MDECAIVLVESDRANRAAAVVIAGLLGVPLSLHYLDLPWSPVAVSGYFVAGLSYIFLSPGGRIELTPRALLKADLTGKGSTIWLDDVDAVDVDWVPYAGRRLCVRSGSSAINIPVNADSERLRVALGRKLQTAGRRPRLSHSARGALGLWR
jgi:hypothetical protein